MPEDYDPFWDSHADRERAKAEATWPHAFSVAAFWLAIVVIVWLLCGHPGLH